MYKMLSNHTGDLLEFVIVHTKSISKSVMQITPTSSNAVRADGLSTLSAGWFVVFKYIDIFPFVSRNVSNL